MPGGGGWLAFDFVAPRLGEPVRVAASRWLRFDPDEWEFIRQDDHLSDLPLSTVALQSCCNGGRGRDIRLGSPGFRDLRY